MALSLYKSMRNPSGQVLRGMLVALFPEGHTVGATIGTDQFLSNDEGESFIPIEDYAFALLDEIEKPQIIRQRLAFRAKVGYALCEISSPPCWAWYVKPAGRLSAAHGRGV